MVIFPELLCGYITYFILQLIVYHFSSKDPSNIRYGYTNAISTYIWCFGIMLLLRRFECNFLRNIKNPFIRFTLQILFILTTLELLLGVWGCIETMVLQWMPNATNYVVNSLGFGNQKIWEWPFVMILWVISSICAHYANNVDRIVDYYFCNEEDSEETPNEPIRFIGEEQEEEESTVPNNTRSRGKYTLVMSPPHLEPEQLRRHVSRRRYASRTRVHSPESS